MKVILYSESAADQWLVEAICDVAECFPDDPESTAAAIADLERCGEHITRAKPIFRLIKLWPP
jgi:hypothetical protein